jgi:hypothetical protein
MVPMIPTLKSVVSDFRWTSVLVNDCGCVQRPLSMAYFGTNFMVHSDI